MAKNCNKISGRNTFPGGERVSCFLLLGKYVNLYTMNPVFDSDNPCVKTG